MRIKVVWGFWVPHLRVSHSFEDSAGHPCSTASCLQHVYEKGFETCAAFQVFISTLRAWGVAPLWTSNAARPGVVSSPCSRLDKVMARIHMVKDLDLS